MWFLALRQLLSKKKQTFLIFLGISFGTMIYVIIAGIQFGMREYLAEQLLNNTAHIIISGNERLIEEPELRRRFFSDGDTVHWIVPPSGKRDESRLENPAGWFSRLEDDPNVVAFAPRLSINAILSKGRIRQSVSVTGIVPEKHIKVTSLEDFMREGSLLDLRSGNNTIILGSAAAKEIGARMGDTIPMSTGLGEPRPFKVVGIVHLGNEQIDKTLALSHINDVQNMNRSPGRVSEISVAISDMDRASQVATEWSVFSSDKVQGWQEANASFMQVIKIQDLVRIVITGAILLVSAFGIYNVLSIMISQKQKEIAILRSLGYGPKKILSLILIQGLTLGFWGSLAGLLLGHVANVYIDNIDIGIDIGKGSTLVVSYKASIYFTAFAAAQVSAAIASFLPARHAAGLTPLEIIRSNI